MPNDSDYTLTTTFTHLIPGMILFIEGDPPGKVGDQFLDYPAEITAIKYRNRPWWAFWQKRKAVGFDVLWKGRSELKCMRQSTSTSKAKRPLQ